MAVKKSENNSKSRSASGNKRSSGSKLAFIFKLSRTSIVYLLALYGLHVILQDNLPAYKKFAQKQYENIVKGSEIVGDKVSPQPTITIKSSSDLKNTPYDNLSLGVPTFKCDVIIDRVGYALGYSEKYEQPLWVSYKLTAGEVKSKRAKRSNDFRSDPDIPGKSASPEDYKKSFFDRGHLAPAADMSFSLQAMSESFYMSNMSPQRPELNRGIWKKLEENVRYFAEGCGEIYVVTGPLFEPNLPCITIGKNKVAVPDKYYKVILDTTASSPKAIGFILPNGDTQDDLASFAVTVDAVERASGLDFFSELNDRDEAELESSFDYSKWEKMLPAKKRKRSRLSNK